MHFSLQLSTRVRQWPIAGVTVVAFLVASGVAVAAPAKNEFRRRKGEVRRFLTFKQARCECPPFGYRLVGNVPPTPKADAPRTFEVVGKVKKNVSECEAGHRHHQLDVRVFRPVDKAPRIDNRRGYWEKKRE